MSYDPDSDPGSELEKMDRLDPYCDYDSGSDDSDPDSDSSDSDLDEDSSDSVRVIVCDEQFTSKTCGKCGNLNANLRSSKLFQCPDRQGCGHIADRDANAARNIMIRYLTLKRCKMV